MSKKIEPEIDQPGIDPKILKKQERQKLYQELNEQRLHQKQAKIAERKKVREEYIKQNLELNKLEKICKEDIKNKLQGFKQQLQNKTINKKDAKGQFKQYRKERINQFRADEQRVLNLSSEQLKQSGSYRMKRWFFGVGKEFSRVSWIHGKQVLKDFGIILVLVAIMALIFLGLDYAINAIPKG